MSKTMDNDHQNPYSDFANTIQQQAAEIERLKADVKRADGARQYHYEWGQGLLKERDTLHTQVEELSAIYKAEFERGYNTRIERDTLRARVDEVQRDNVDLQHWIKGLEAERDALRADRDEAERVASWRNGEIARLQAELEQIKQGNEMNHSTCDLAINTLKAENARLKAELAATKSKQGMFKCKTRIDLFAKDVWINSLNNRWSQDNAIDNVELTFVDGVLTAAEVIK